jgi:hypothetical protein
MKNPFVLYAFSMISLFATSQVFAQSVGRTIPLRVTNMSGEHLLVTSTENAWANHVLRGQTTTLQLPVRVPNYSIDLSTAPGGPRCFFRKTGANWALIRATRASCTIVSVNPLAFRIIKR